MCDYFRFLYSNFQKVEREREMRVAKPLLLIIFGAIILLIHWNLDMFMESSILSDDEVVMVDKGMSEKETGYVRSIAESKRRCV